MLWRRPGEATRRMDKLSERMAAAKAAKAARAEVRQLLEEAGALGRKGRPREAESRWRRVVELQPDHAEALAALVVAALHRRDFAEAIRFGERAVALKPKESGWWSNLGVARMDLGDHGTHSSRIRDVANDYPVSNGAGHAESGARRTCDVERDTAGRPELQFHTLNGEDIVFYHRYGFAREQAPHCDNPIPRHLNEAALFSANGIAYPTFTSSEAQHDSVRVQFSQSRRGSRHLNRMAGEEVRYGDAKIDPVDSHTYRR